jgi:hypothetical protein
LGLPPLVNPYPALNLDFINNQTLDSRVTFSRGSQATLFDSTGTLKFAASNVIRNSTGVGAVVGTPGTDPTNWVLSPAASGLTKEIVATGTESGIAYIDVRYYGTPSAGTNVTISFEAANSVAASSGQTWTQSTYVKLQAGSFTNTTTTLSLLGTNGTSGTEAFTSSTITSTPSDLQNCRLSVTGTLAQATTTHVQPRVRIGYTVGAAFDITLRIGVPQLERGSVATAVNPTSGTAYYAPRFDYNPSTLQPLGLLIEEARTNSIRNNTMVGAVAGTPGTVPTNWVISTASGNLTSREIVGIGTENGIAYVDVRFVASGAVSASIYPESPTGVAALNAQTWTTAFYVKLTSGSLTNVTVQTSIVENDSGGNFLAGANGSAFVPTSAALATQRFTQTRTNTNASTAFEWSRVLVTFSGAGDVTLRIGLPQLELGAFATSVIPTTTTALTRNADVASMTGTNFSSWYNASEGTLFAEASANGAAGGSFIASIQDSAATSYIRVRQNLGGVAVLGQAASSSGSTPGLAQTNFTVNTPFKIIIAAKSSDVAVSCNGGAVGTDSAMTTMPIVDRLTIGTSGFYLIRRIAYYPTRLPNTTLQALTA